MENSSEKEVIKILIRNDKKSEIFYYVFADEKDNICMDGSVVITKNRSINYKMCVSNKGEIASEHVYLDDKFRKARKTKKEVFCLNEFVRGIFKEEYVDSYYSLPPDVIEKFNKVFNIEKKHVFNQ